MIYGDAIHRIIRPRRARRNLINTSVSRAAQPRPPDHFVRSTRIRPISLSVTHISPSYVRARTRAHVREHIRMYMRISSISISKRFARLQHRQQLVHNATTNSAHTMEAVPRLRWSTTNRFFGRTHARRARARAIN